MDDTYGRGLNSQDRRKRKKKKRKEQGEQDGSTLAEHLDDEEFEKNLMGTSTNFRKQIRETPRQKISMHRSEVQKSRLGQMADAVLRANDKKQSVVLKVQDKSKTPAPTAKERAARKEAIREKRKRQLRRMLEQMDIDEAQLQQGERIVQEERARGREDFAGASLEDRSIGGGVVIEERDFILRGSHLDAPQDATEYMLYSQPTKQLQPDSNRVYVEGKQNGDFMHLKKGRAVKASIDDAMAVTPTGAIDQRIQGGVSLSFLLVCGWLAGASTILSLLVSTPDEDLPGTAKIYTTMMAHLRFLIYMSTHIAATLALWRFIKERYHSAHKRITTHLDHIFSAVIACLYGVALFLTVLSNPEDQILASLRSKTGHDSVKALEQLQIWIPDVQLFEEMKSWYSIKAAQAFFLVAAWLCVCIKVGFSKQAVLRAI